MAGGESPAAKRLTPGLGTTQLSGQPGRPAPPCSTSGPSTPPPGAAPGRAASGAGVPRRRRGRRLDGLDGRRRDQRHAGRRRSRCSPRTPGSAPPGRPGAGSPYFGAKLLIADRGNNRLLLLDAPSTWCGPTRRPPRRAPVRLLLPRRRLLHPPRHGDHLQPGGERDDRRDRLPVGEDPLVLRPSRPARAPPRATCTSPTTPTCSRTARSPWPTPRTAGSCSSTANGTVAGQIGTTACACTTPRPRWALPTATPRWPTATSSSRRSTGRG